MHRKSLRTRYFNDSMTSSSGIIGQQDGALAEKLGNGLQNRVDGSVTRRCLHFKRADGGIGRHERLKISWLYSRAGSSPALRTNLAIHECSRTLIFVILDTLS